MKRLLCAIIGHDPRGPVDTDQDPVIYGCYRCHDYIYFDKDRGWVVLK